MSRLRSALVSLALLGACRALPSAIPLADTGEGRSSEDGALGLNRVPLARRGSHGDASGRDRSGADESSAETVTIVASAADAGDAGVPEAGTLADDAGAVHWAGEYFGSDRHAVTVGRNQPKAALDDKAHTRVEEPSPGVVVFSLVSSAGGEVICALRAKATGARAELDSGQACLGLEMPPMLSVGGSAKLDGDALELDVDAHGEITSEDDSIDVLVDYHFEGKRR